MIVSLLLALWISGKYSEGIAQFVIGTGFITFLAQSLVNNFLNKRFEDYKSQLSLENTKQGRLHEKRLQVISEFYALLVNLQENTMRMIATIKLVNEDAQKEEAERIQKTADSFNAASRVYWLNKLYFQSDVCKIVEVLLEKYKHVYYNYSTEQQFSIAITKEEILHKKEIWENTQGEISKILNEIETNFRDSLGLS